MAYRAEIQIGVKGTEKLEQIKKKIQSIDQKVEQVNARWKKIRSGIPTKEFGEVNKKLQKTIALQARAKALAAATEKRLKGQNSVTRGLLGLNKAVLNAARSEAQARGESVAKQRALNRELAKSQQYSRPIGPQPQRAAPTRRRSTAFFGGEKNVLKLGAAYLSLNTAVRQVGRSIDAATQAASGEQRIKALSAGFDDYREVLAATERAQEKFNLGTIESQDAFAQLFGRLRPAGFALSEVETIFNGFNTAAALTGATARESAGALLQLTQALGAGFLSGQEFNSVAEQAPGVLQAIAKEVDRPVGQLKQLAKDGKLTSEVLLKALQRVEIEGADRLAEALDTPAQKVKNLQNRIEDLNIAFGDLILPAVIDGVGSLAKAAEFATEDINKTALAMKTLNEKIQVFREENPATTKAVDDFGNAFLRNIEKAIPFIGYLKTILGLRDQLAGEQPKFANDGFIGPQVPENSKPLKERLGILDDPKSGNDKVTKTADQLLSIDWSKALGVEEARLQLQITEQQGQAILDGNQALFDRLEFTKGTLRTQLEIEAITKAIVQAEQQVAKYAGDAVLGAEAQVQLQDLKNGKLERELNLRNQISSNENDKLLDDLEAAEAFGKLVQNLEPLKRELTPIEETLNNIGGTITNGLVDGLALAITETDKLGESFQQLAADILEAIGKQLILTAITQGISALGGGDGVGLFSMLSGGLGKREDGGPVLPNRPYLVGEAGPELVVPNSAGTVVDAKTTSAAMSRWNSGNSNGVGPEAGGGDVFGSGGSAGAAQSINVTTGPVMQFQGDNFVSQKDFQAGLAQAAQQGAKAGEAMTLKRLKNSQSTRRKVGI